MRYFEIISEAAQDCPPILYHATYRPYVRGIRRDGLHGNNPQKNYEDSQGGIVYLARTPEVAESYAETSDTVPGEWLDQIVVLQVNTSQIDLERLHADANVIDGTDTWQYHGTIPPAAIRVHQSTFFA
jgi:hypothetical protein